LVSVVSQIIISQEDSTGFFSIGSVQNDATLVSALGGALSSFAVEIGLSDSETAQANYSKFKNGILISKWLTIGMHHPMLMIAVRGFKDLASYHQMFLLEYGSLLAEKILTKYEKVYESQGAVPKFAEAVKLLPVVAYSLFKSSPSTLREFSQFAAPSCQAFLDDIWNTQHEKSLLLKSIRKEFFAPSKTTQFLDDFVTLFYQEGTRNDAFFPLNFATSPDLSAARKYVHNYLQKKASQSRKELSEEVALLVQRLQQFSDSRRSKKRVSLSGIDFFNTNVLFEQLAMLKRASFEKERLKILENLFSTIYQKLFKKFPLKFLAANLIKPLTIDFVRETFTNTVNHLLKLSLKKEAFSHQLFLLMRDLSSQYSPEEIIRNSGTILSEVKEQFIATLPKTHPFIALVDSNFLRTRKLVERLAQEAFEQYRTAHDEAMALWYVLRRINQRTQQLKSISFSNQMRLFFLQKLIRKYQFRPVPDLFYTLCKRILSNIVKTSKKAADPVHALIQRQLQSFEKDSNILIPPETSAAILRKIKRIKSTQKFENIEALSYFSKVFSYALEDTIVKVLEEFFGTIKKPSAPRLLRESLQIIIDYSDSLYQIGRLFQEIKQQPGFQRLLTTDAKKIFTKTLSFETVIPSPVEIARIAFTRKFFVPTKEQKGKDKALVLETLTKNQLLSLPVAIPEMPLEGSLGSLLKEPAVIKALLFKFFEPALIQRHRSILLEVKKVEQRLKQNTHNSKNKKSLTRKLKSLKELSNAYKLLISGGNLFQRLFTRVKPLKKVISRCSKESFPAFTGKRSHYLYGADYDYPPQQTNFVHQPVSTFGEYQRVVEVYASTWVRDSVFIDKLQEKLLWDLVKKEVEKGSIESKILANLRQEAYKGEQTDQTIIIRKTIEEEVLVLFNHAVREAIANVFVPISDEAFVKYHQRSKSFLFPLTVLPLPLDLLSIYFDKISCCKLLKSSNETVEISLNLSTLLPTVVSRKKQSQSIRNFLFDGMREFMRSYFLKTLDSLGELVDAYIGQQAADLFYTKSRFFERLVLESIKQS